MIASPREIARALGGEVVGGQVLAPGPGHNRRDRSLSVKLSASAPGGFLAFSHAGDDWQVCRDHVRRLLGGPVDDWKRERQGAPRRALEARREPIKTIAEDDEQRERIAGAVALWCAAIDPRSTPVEHYLASRRLELAADIAGDVIRWHSGIGAMVALFRDVHTDEPRAVSRTFLDKDARKIERKFLGPVGGCAIKLDADDTVLGGLHIGEGIETCMAARQYEQLRPTWALGSVGAISSFPILGGIECLTLLTENDCNANASAIEACGIRCQDAGREVLVNRPLLGKDLNDSILQVTQ
jgi:hypothetical protein